MEAACGQLFRGRTHVGGKPALLHELRPEEGQIRGTAGLDPRLLSSQARACSLCTVLLLPASAHLEESLAFQGTSQPRLVHWAMLLIY